LLWQKVDETRAETRLLLQRLNDVSRSSETDEKSREKYVRDFMAPLILESKLEQKIINNYREEIQQGLLSIRQKPTNEKRA